MKLSVIIPIYQAEATLERCIRSITGQTFSRLEIILVIDGATDKSAEICHYWEKHDGRIAIIEKTNGGLSDARNAGLSIATGDYVTFVDADDEVERSTYAQLCDILTAHPEYDILEYPFLRHYGSTGESLYPLGNAAFTELWSGYWAGCKAYEHTYACNKLFRRDLLTDVRFEYGRKFEDVYFLTQVLNRASTVATTDKGCYFYYDTPTGITMSASGLDLRDLLEAHCKTLEALTTEEYDEYYSHVLNIQLDVFHHCGEIMLRRRRTNIHNINGLANKAKCLILNTLGMHTLCKIHSTATLLRK